MANRYEKVNFLLDFGSDAHYTKFVEQCSTMSIIKELYMHAQTSHGESFCIQCADNASSTTDAISLFCKLYDYLIEDIWFASESDKIDTRLSNGATLHCHRVNADIVKLELCPGAPRPVQFFEMRFRHGHWYLGEHVNLVH